jgi:hypothetical protein
LVRGVKRVAVGEPGWEALEERHSIGTSGSIVVGTEVGWG